MRGSTQLQIFLKKRLSQGSTAHISEDTHPKSKEDPFYHSVFLPFISREDATKKDNLRMNQIRGEKQVDHKKNIDSLNQMFFEKMKAVRGDRIRATTELKTVGQVPGKIMERKEASVENGQSRNYQALRFTRRNKSYDYMSQNSRISLRRLQDFPQPIPTSQVLEQIRIHQKELQGSYEYASYFAPSDFCQ